MSTEPKRAGLLTAPIPRVQAFVLVGLAIAGAIWLMPYAARQEQAAAQTRIGPAFSKEEAAKRAWSVVYDWQAARAVSDDRVQDVVGLPREELAVYVSICIQGGRPDGECQGEIDELARRHKAG